MSNLIAGIPGGILGQRVLQAMIPRRPKIGTLPVEQPGHEQVVALDANVAGRLQRAPGCGVEVLHRYERQYTRWQPEAGNLGTTGCRFRRGKLQLLKLQDRRMALDVIWP